MCITVCEHLVKKYFFTVRNCYPPLDDCPRLHCQYICSCPPRYRPFLHPQPEDAPCRGDRDPIITVKHTLTICKTYCFSIVTMVARKRLRVTFIRTLPALFLPFTSQRTQSLQTVLLQWQPGTDVISNHGKYDIIQFFTHSISQSAMNFPFDHFPKIKCLVL